MPNYIPSCVVNLTLKFDDRLTIADDVGAISAQEGLEQPNKAATPKQAQPLILNKGAVSSVVARVPKSASIERPGIRQAGKWSMVFDFAELPIDPRTIAAASVEIHMGTITPSNFAKGMAGRETDGSRLSVLRTLTTSGTPNLETLRMVGTVDEWVVYHNDSGSVAELSGRDFRGVLLDTPINTDPEVEKQVIDSLDLSQPIHKVVIQILSFHAYFAGFTVLANAADWPNGQIPAPGGLEKVPRHRKGAKGKRKSGRGTPPGSSNSGGNLSYWDLITRFCYLVGAVPYMDVQGQIVIRPGKTVYDRLAGPADPETNPTPFRGGRTRNRDAESGAAISPELRVRRMLYGRDTESITFSRKFAGPAKPRVVRVFCWDPNSGKAGGAMVFGLWPPREDKPKPTKSAPGKAPAQEEIVNVRVSGITDKEQLTQIAESIFNQTARGEMGGTVSTPNLGSFGGDNTDPDLLSLMPGDGVELLHDVRSLRSGAPLVSTLTDHYRKSFAEAVADIKTLLGKDDNIARVIVATSRGQINELQRFFLVTTTKFVWTDESGIKISFDFTNYVVARWSSKADEGFDSMQTITIEDDHRITLRSPTPRTRRPTKPPSDPQYISIDDEHVITARSPLRQR